MTRLLVIAALALHSAPAAAQSAPASAVRVTIGINLFVAAPTEAGADAIKAQEDARRRIYQIATRECAILLDVMASDCKLENVNVHANRTSNPQQGDGFNIGGNLSYRVLTK